jgi:putative transposase
MKRSRFSEAQIIGILKEHQAGLSAQDLCRKHGISDATFYNWRRKYGGMDVADAKRQKALEAAKEIAERERCTSCSRAVSCNEQDLYCGRKFCRTATGAQRSELVMHFRHECLLVDRRAHVSRLLRPLFKLNRRRGHVLVWNQ